MNKDQYLDVWSELLTTISAKISVSNKIGMKFVDLF